MHSTTKRRQDQESHHLRPQETHRAQIDKYTCVGEIQDCIRTLGLAAAGGGGAGGRAGRSTTGATHARVLVLNATLLGVVSSGGNVGVLGSIDSNRDPGEDTLGHIVTDQNVLHERINGVGLLGQDAVIGIGGQILSVGGVGRGLLDIGDQVLVEEELADMGRLGGVQVAECMVSLDLGLIGSVGQNYDGVVSINKALDMERRMGRCSRALP